MKYLKIALLILLGVTTLIAATTSSKAKGSLLEPVVSIEGKIVVDEFINLKNPVIYIFNENNKKIGKFAVNEIDKSFYITGLKPDTKYYLALQSENSVSEKIEIATPITDEFIEIQQNLKFQEFSSELETAKK